MVITQVNAGKWLINIQFGHRNVQTYAVKVSFGKVH